MFVTERRALERVLLGNAPGQDDRSGRRSEKRP